MTAQVHSMGYVVFNVTDIPAWLEFANAHGLQVTEHDDEHVFLRVDERTWRIELRKADTDGINAKGWEVQGPDDIAELSERLREGGYEVSQGEPEIIAHRKVTDLVWFTDPSGYRVELFYGQKKSRDPFVSPTGAEFETGDLGLGHLMMFVDDSDEYRRLYMDILRFRLSDFIDIGPDPGTFLHCNPRHHSIAFANLPGTPARLGHLMLQVKDVNTVGQAYDWVLAGNAKLGSSLGRHTNDEMLSYYVKTPSGFEIEFGFGGLLIDDETWVPGRWNDANFWGHDRGGSKLPG